MNAKSILLGAALASSSLFAAIRTEPVNLYVSENGDWDPSGSGYTYTTIQGAVADATVAGDVVWVKDGFHCTWESGSTKGTGVQVIVLSSKAITIRSESGYVDEAAEKGAYITGPGDKSATSWSNTRCVELTAAGAQLIGLVIEEGASGQIYAHSGGGVYLTSGVISNCVIRNCYGLYGAGVFGAGKIYDSVISNCTATVGSGGAYATAALDCYNTLFENNVAGANGGGGYAIKTSSGYCPILSNCTFRGNSAYSSGTCYGGGGLSANTTLTGDAVKAIDCKFYSNTSKGYGGAAMGSNLFRGCTFIGNSVTGSTTGFGGGAVYGLKDGASGEDLNTMTPPTRPAVLEDCLVASNVCNESGAGIAYARATKGTRLIGNVTYRLGGASTYSILTDCLVLDNISTNSVGAPGFAGKGAGVYASWATNCVISGNLCCGAYPDGKGGTSVAGNGGGAYNSELVGCIVSNNFATSNGGGACFAVGRVCANCQFVDNVSQSGGGAMSLVATTAIYNSLFARNRQYGATAVAAGGACGLWNGTRANWKPLKLVNCTVVDNSAEKSPGGVNIVDLVNTIVWGNKGTRMADSGIPSAKNSCVEFLTAIESGSDNIDDDPKFRDGYFLKAGSPCRNTGYYDAAEMPWAADEADPRHLDLAGRSRLNGTKIDRGCYSWWSKGLQVLIR